jgi:hypothetical protein
MEQLLTDEEKRRLDKRIDAGLPDTVNFLDKSHPVLTILRAAEIRVIRHDLVIHEVHGSAAGNVASGLTRDGFDHALKIAYASSVTDKAPANATERDLKAAYDLLQKCVDYCEMEDIMTMSWRPGVGLVQLDGDKFLCKMTDDLMAHEASHYLWMKFRAAPEPPAPRLALDEFQNWINSSDTKLPERPEQLIFRVPRNILLGVQESMNVYCQQHWQLPQVPQVDNFNLAQFRCFWPALTTCAVIPKIVFNAMGYVNLGVPIGTKSQWVELLTTLIQLDAAEVSDLIDFVTFSIQTTTPPKGVMVAGACCQPFFRVGDELALSSFLAIGSSAERNLFVLLANKHTKTYDRIKKEKEDQWSHQLADMFRGAGLHAIPQRPMRTDKKSKGDIDLFIHDKKNQTALVVQLKWLLVDKIKKNHIDEAENGIRQAKLAVEWITANHKQAAHLLGVSHQDLLATKLLPVVVLREGMLGGFVQDPDVPLISKEIFDYYSESCNTDLRCLWQNLFDKNYLPITGEDFIFGDDGQAPSSGIPMNGVTFKKHQILPGHKTFTPRLDRYTRR